MLLALLVPAVQAADAPSQIRIRLFEDTATPRLTLRAEAPLRLAGPATLTRLDAGSEYTLTLDGTSVLVGGRGLSERVASLSLEGAFTLTIPGGGRLSRRTYEGSLRVDADPGRASTLRLVHGVDLETYVSGVVQREYGMDDLEGSKAMAVAARTYALRTKGRWGSAYDLVDNISAQVFFGLDGVRATARDAASTTRGEVLLYNDRLIEAVYSASSGGYTADNDDVWGTDAVPYLRARPDPYDAAVSPHARWRTAVSREALLSALSRAASVPVEGFTLIDTPGDERLVGVRLDLAGGRTQTLAPSRFRSIVNGTFGGMSLRSTRFTHRLEGSESIFEGSGFGHGVGLSQWGARGQALAGRSYRDILGFYYPGTTLAVLGDSDLRLRLPSTTDPIGVPILAEAAEAPEVVTDPGFTAGVAVADAAGTNAAVDAALDRMRGAAQPVPSRSSAPARTDARRAEPARTDAPRAEPARADASATAAVGRPSTGPQPVSATRAPSWSTPATSTTPTRARGAW